MLFTCRFYDINFYKSLPNGLELLQLSSSSWFLFQLGSWKAKINCVKPTLKKTTYGIASSDINLCHAVWPLQHYKCLTGFLVSEVGIFSNRKLKHAFFFQLLMSKFCYFVITFIYQPCVLQLDFKCFIFSLKNIAKLLKLELTSRNRKFYERDHQTSNMLPGVLRFLALVG